MRASRNKPIIVTTVPNTAGTGRRPGARSLTALPRLAGEAAAIGAMVRGAREVPCLFTTGEVERAAVLAGQAAIAIRNARLRADLSQEDTATRMGITQGTISFWERDVETPTLDNLIKLLAQFHDLLGDIRVHQQEVIKQLRQIERALFDGQCACENCGCNSHAGT